MPPKYFLNESKSIECIIFDLDGTLYDFAPQRDYRKVSAVYALSAHKNIPKNEARIKLEKNLRYISGDISYSKVLRDLDVPLIGWHKIYDDLFDISMVHSNKILSELIVEAGKRHKLSILTNSTRYLTNLILEKIGLSTAETIDLFITFDSGFGIKPNKDALLKICQKLGTEAQKCVSIGDRYEYDIEPALETGMSGILVSGQAQTITAIASLVKKRL